MNKSSLSVLAKAVASKRGLTQAEAERFIATMFEVAGDGIQEDKLLKMNNLSGRRRGFTDKRGVGSPGQTRTVVLRTNVA